MEWNSEEVGKEVDEAEHRDFPLRNPLNEVM